MPGNSGQALGDVESCGGESMVSNVETETAMSSFRYEELPVFQSVAAAGVFGMATL